MLERVDPEIYNIIQKEIKRQQNVIELIPSENFASLAVLQALGSVLTNKYSEGYSHKRYYGGNEFIDEAEDLAIKRAKELFNAEHVNVQPYSGSPANIAVYFAFLNPGDKVLGMNLAHGGHLTHGHPINFSGKIFNFVQYGLDEKTEVLDYEKIKEIAEKEKPKMIVSGASAYPREINFKKIHEIAESVNAISFADISHIAGLIVAGIHPSPFPFTDVVTTTTHKTLRGPRGAMILCKEKFAKDIDRAVFPGTQGGPHNHVNAAKAVAFKEASSQEFKEYIKQVVKNAKTLAEELKKYEFRLISGGTDNHLILIDLTNKNISGKDAEKILDSIGITVNKNMIPFDKKSPFDPSGIRLGTPAMTTRGMKEEEMKIIANLISETIKYKNDSLRLEEIKKQVLDLTSKFPLYPELNKL
jgi:glycine hydroxymethyltransferase